MTDKKKCYQCKRRNHKGFTLSLAPDTARFCSVECIDKYAVKYLKAEEKLNSL